MHHYLFVHSHTKKMFVFAQMPALSFKFYLMEDMEESSKLYQQHKLILVHVFLQKKKNR